ncbi:hypothetical protein MRS44_016540 [Fusarium solani]|uniref:Uncharacterized protein n=1 Tax=Fusarium solani TaxID=169388 RepID=A0A9P9HE53_FUSSL|nr:uncharacterized protein B0J15DRAFT_559203 [Fusarium solani]KAH7254799.1 hypothetical protein B0J15DRAFT_559203 [Fusarium solani]KAJ3456517.1 hypothetical protein MRS44_016540 [Fusarium solani]
MSYESPIPGMSQNQSFIGPTQSIQALIPISVQRQRQRQNNIPDWFEQHVLDSIISPATRSLINLIWITEAFDHFNEGHFELPEHLCQVQPELLREWNRRNKGAGERVEASKTNSRKRGAEDTPGPVAKRENNHVPVTRERRAATIETIPPLRKYDAIYTVGEVDCGQIVYHHDLLNSLVLSFGDGDTMRGALSLGEFVHGLLFFEKRAQAPSVYRVPFTWRGRDRLWKRTYSGYTNKGWIQFLDNGSVKGWLDKFRIKFEGRREGDSWARVDYCARQFWWEWNHRYLPDEVEEMDDSSSSEDCDMEE